MNRFKKIEKRVKKGLWKDEIRIGNTYISFGKENGGKRVNFYSNNNDKNEFAFEFTADESGRKISPTGNILYNFGDGKRSDLKELFEKFIGVGILKTEKEGNLFVVKLK